LHKVSAQPSIFLAGTFLSQHGGSRAPIEDLAAELRERGYPLMTASPYRGRLMRVTHLLLAALWFRRKADIAVVDLYSGRAFFWGAGIMAILRFLRCPVILALHGGELPSYARKYPKMVASQLRRASAVIAPSSYLVRQMQQYRGDIQLLPNPLPLSSFRFVHRMGVRPKLVWVRGFHSIYNPELAVRVLAALKQNFPQASLTMVGGHRGDDSFHRTRQLVDDLGLQSSVQMVGSRPRNEVSQFLDEADIFLNTTDIDNTPVSVMEAMSCGLCIVSTDVGGIPHLLENETDALLVPRNDPAAMANAVERLVRDHQLATRLSAAARQKAEHFDWSAVFPLWENLVHSLVGSKQ